jgi:hypothetical protein
VKAAIGVEKLDFVNSFGDLEVTLAEFGAWFAAGAEDGVGGDVAYFVCAVGRIHFEILAILEGEEGDGRSRPRRVCLLKRGA